MTVNVLSEELSFKTGFEGRERIFQLTSCTTCPGITLYCVRVIHHITCQMATVYCVKYYNLTTCPGVAVYCVKHCITVQVVLVLCTVSNTTNSPGVTVYCVKLLHSITCPGVTVYCVKHCITCPGVAMYLSYCYTV